MAPRKAVAALLNDCCGECKFFRQIPETKQEFGCFVSPPVYSHIDDDIVIFVRNFYPCKATEYACKDFKPRNSQ